MTEKVRSAAQAKKDFERSLASLSYSIGLWNVFEDFLEYCLLMLRWQDRKPEHFKRLEERYADEKQHKLFAAAFLALSDMADNDGQGFRDPFGDYFMEHFSNDHRGQFFTPDSLCDMMAQMRGLEAAPAGTTVCDPTCGSGRLILSAAKINRHCKFYAADVDLRCCQMTVINMMMNSVAGEVAWMNSLTMEHWKSWHIKLMQQDGHYIPYYLESGPGETHFVERLKNSLNEVETAPMKTTAKGQLLLFDQ